MRSFLTNAMLAATALTLTACSGAGETNTASVNETVPANEDLTATDDLSGGNLEFDNSVGLDANATDLDASAGNGF